MTVCYHRPWPSTSTCSRPSCPSRWSDESRRSCALGKLRSHSWRWHSPARSHQHEPVRRLDLSSGSVARMMMRIRAHAIKEKGGRAEPFSYERAVGEHDVVVRITHRSIARGDIQFIDDDWGDARFPLVPGHEIVGLVEEAGSDVTDLQLGDRVGTGFQQQACFECAFCRQGIEQLCPTRRSLPSTRMGGWRSYRRRWSVRVQAPAASSTRLRRRPCSRPA